MDAILTFICQNAHSAHWMIFLLLLLAGLNVPISEDILLLGAGAIASTCIPDHTLHLFLWTWAGCWISAWEAYWVGRLLGPKLYTIRWFSHVITPQRIERLHHYYEKFGIFAFIFGRFCPGGVRNALFMTSGLGKMPFSVFLMRDGIACALAASTIFYIGYCLGGNYKVIATYIAHFGTIILSVVATVAITAIIVVWIRKRKTVDHS
jgi:membrane protein DedA with SNARE-associated domain